MSEITWIKIKTGMFEDEKIKIIESMPEGDAMIVIWVKMLCMAGKRNEGGEIAINATTAYTPDMLATVFNKHISVVKMALSTFQQFGMIEMFESGVIEISNWEKHQNIIGLDKIKEQNKLRQQKYRESKKIKEGSNVTVTLHNAIDKEEEKDKELDKEKEKKDSGLQPLPKTPVLRQKTIEEEIDKVESYSLVQNRIEEKRLRKEEEEKKVHKRQCAFLDEIKKALKKRPQYVEFREDLNDFFYYWTQITIGHKKMKFEKETSFSIIYRLDKWFRNKEKWATKDEKLTTEQQLSRKNTAGSRFYSEISNKLKHLSD